MEVSPQLWACSVNGTVIGGVTLAAGEGGGGKKGKALQLEDESHLLPTGTTVSCHLLRPFGLRGCPPVGQGRGAVHPQENPWDSSPDEL